MATSMNSTNSISSVNVSIEPLDEYHVQEISYDGQEKLIQPLTMSENLKKLVHKIDFSKSVESIEEMAFESVSNGADQEKQVKETNTQQAVLWPWDGVRNKLRNALTEISVLLDTINIAKDHKYLVLDPVSQEQSEYNPLSTLIAKKQSLQNAANIILSSVTRLKTAQSDLNRCKIVDFQSELKSLRLKWRLKKTGNVIIGDLSYRNAGSRYQHSGAFEVIKNELNNSSEPQNLLNVIVPSDLEGICYVHISIHKDNETFCESKVLMPSYFSTMSWQKKLENAQNVLFCKELFSQLAREAINIQEPITTLVIRNQIIITLMTGVQLIIALCHSQSKNKKAIEDDEFEENIRIIKQNEHLHTLEHSLHQLLRDIHYQALHQPIPHPATATLGISRKRYFAGPECIDKQTLIECQKTETILEKITAQAQHMVLREQTMKVVDDLVLKIKDPLIVAHWLSLNSPTFSSVKLNIISYGYENLTRTPLVIHIKTKSLVVISRDGRKFHLSYEPEELRHLIIAHISHHEAYAIHSLTKIMGWKVLNFTSNCGYGPLEKSGTASSLLLYFPNAEKLLSIRFGVENHVCISVNNDEENFKPGEIVSDIKWFNIRKNFKQVDIEKMEGKNFLNKMEFIMACLAKY